MKRIKLFLIAALSLSGLFATAQNVDEIISKNIEAMGGKEKIGSLKTVKMTGSMSVQGMDITMIITKTHLIGTRTDIEFNGNSYFQFANATKGMVFMPPMTDAEEMDGETFKSFVNQMDIQGSLFNYKEKGNTVELVGTEKLAGGDAYNLKLTYKNGRVSNYFIDKATNRLVKAAGTSTVQGQEMKVESTFSDYKQNGDGYWFPFTITSMRGPISFSKIETNIAIDEKVYAN